MEGTDAALYKDGFMGTAHTDEDIVRTVAVAEDVCQEVS